MWSSGAVGTCHLLSKGPQSPSRAILYARLPFEVGRNPPRRLRSLAISSFPRGFGYIWGRIAWAFERLQVRVHRSSPCFTALYRQPIGICEARDIILERQFPSQRAF